LYPKKEEREQIKKQVREIRMNESGTDKTPVFISVLNPVRIHEHLSHPLWLLQGS
jgi:hypothetical protein